MKRLVITSVALVMIFLTGALASADMMTDFPSITYVADVESLTISAEGFNREDVLDITWNGDSISSQFAMAIEAGIVQEIPTDAGFDIIIPVTTDVLEEINGGVFGIITPTGLPLTVKLDFNGFAGETLGTEISSNISVRAAAAWLIFNKPSDGSTIRNCLYASTSCLNKGLYHTGVDYSGSVAVATADGTVARVESMNSRDHGMGSNVILSHKLSDGRTVYSTYNHLASIDSKIRVGKKVTRGQRVGVIGGSGYGKPNYYSKHLHFEIKTAPVTNSPCGGLYWGYTPRHPDKYCYYNPSNFIQ